MIDRTTELTAQDRRRLAILGFEPKPGQDFYPFGAANLLQMHQLLTEGLADPDETQNFSPTIRAFVDYMAQHPNAYAHGYLIALRTDARVSLEGVGLTGPVDLADALDFWQHFHDADECEADIDGARCWYD